MDSPFRFEGRVWIRLSDLPKENLLAAAAKIADDLIRTEGGIPAITKATLVRRVAEDPAKAAIEFPDECVNRVFSVSVEAYEKAMRVPKSRKAVA